MIAPTRSLPARFDVVIVGAGLAGLTAAVRCAIDGRTVGVLERLDDDRYVCNTRLTGGIFHVAYHGVDEPAARMRAAVLESTDGTADVALVDAVANDSRHVVRWLRDLGVRFIRFGPGEWQSRVLAPPPLPHIGWKWRGRGGDVLLRTLEAHLLSKGSTLWRGHRALGLDCSAGVVRGVHGVQSNGRPFEIAAQHVVIADGGFQANTEALRRHLHTVPDRIVQRNARSGIGDGLAMAVVVGAATTDLRAFYGHVLSRDALVNDSLWPYPWVDELARASIVVGPDGLRFADEGFGGIYLANAIARLPDPASTTVVFGEEAWNGPARDRILSTNPHLPRAGGTVHFAQTLRELAKLAGLPAQALADEVARYNAALASGRAHTLAPPRSTQRYVALPIAKPPFRAIPLAAGITYTMGGIRIDADARVLDTRGEPIAGLYAAGSTTGGIEGGPHAGYVGGLCKAGVTGMRAAEHICRYSERTAPHGEARTLRSSARETHGQSSLRKEGLHGK